MWICWVDRSFHPMPLLFLHNTLVNQDTLIDQCTRNIGYPEWPYSQCHYYALSITSYIIHFIQGYGRDSKNGNEFAELIGLSSPYPFCIMNNFYTGHRCGLIYKKYWISIVTMHTVNVKSMSHSITSWVAVHTLLLKMNVNGLYLVSRQYSYQNLFQRDI